MSIRRSRPFFAAGLALAIALVTAMPAAAAQPLSGPRSSAAAPRPGTPAVPDGWQTITYAGVTLHAPGSWPITDFDRSPSVSGCARLDVHAVYLGAPATSDCPSRLLGHTETVQIAAALNPAGSTSPLSITGGTETHPDYYVTSGTSRYAVTVTSGTDPATAKQIAQSIRFAAAATVSDPPGSAAQTSQAATRYAASAASPATSAATQYATATGKIVTTTYTGRGFDACAAPSAAAMQSWLASPYRAVGIYVGGALRGCAQPNLTRDWVDQTLTMGWKLLPIYVGPQAPCTKYSKTVSTDLGIARSQGVSAADDAIASLTALGLPAGTPVYYDMEGYSSGNPATLAACRASVLAFLQTWTDELHSRGYLSGVYSGVTTGIKDLANAGAAYTSPDAIWMARWIDLTKEDPNTAHQPGIPDTYLANHQRIHQYAGGHKATYAGVQLNIDSNQVDAPVVSATGPLWEAPNSCTTSSASQAASAASAGGDADPADTDSSASNADSGIAATQLVGAVPAPTLTMPRVAGSDRYATASLLAESYTADQSGVPSNAIVIANGENYKGGFDALSASYLAGRSNAPILLTGSASLPASTTSAICDVFAGGDSAQRTVYIIGGSDSISAAVATQLGNVYHPAGVTVKVSRIYGSSRYETSAAIARVQFASGGVGSIALTPGGPVGPTAILASGVVNADALSAGPISSALDIPVLLAGASGLDPSVSSALSALGIRNVLVLGGADRIPDAVVSSLRLSGMTVSRIAGSDRYGTAALLGTFARSVGLSGSLVALANGVSGFPDALTAGPYLGRYGGSLLLVPDGASASLPSSVSSFLSAGRGSISSVQALGQPSTVSASVLSAAVAVAGL